MTPITHYSLIFLLPMNKQANHQLKEQILHELQNTTNQFDVFQRDVTNKMQAFRRKLNLLKQKIHSYTVGTQGWPTDDKISSRQDTRKLLPQPKRKNIATSLPLIEFQSDSLGIDFTEQDMEELNSLPSDLDYNHIDLQLDDQQQNNNSSLWEQFKATEREKIMKANPTEPNQLVEEFFQKKWDTLSHKERVAGVTVFTRKRKLQLSKARFKQQLAQHNQSVKVKFQELLSKKTKRDILAEKAQPKRNEPKIFASDLRSYLQTNKSANQQKITALQSKVKQIFQL